MGVMAIVTGVTLRVLACDQAGIPNESWFKAKEEVMRVFKDAGIELLWSEVRGSKECIRPAAGSAYVVVVQARRPKGVSSIDAIGMAPAYRKLAYVFFESVKRFDTRFNSMIGQKFSLGIVLGHAIAHEMGHAILALVPHSTGIMRGSWSYAEWREMFQGLLLFDPDSVEAMRAVIQSQQAAPHTPAAAAPGPGVAGPASNEPALKRCDPGQ
jgi:hypothetical protein